MPALQTLKTLTFSVLAVALGAGSLRAEDIKLGILHSLSGTMAISEGGCPFDSFNLKIR